MPVVPGQSDGERAPDPSEIAILLWLSVCISGETGYAHRLLCRPHAHMRKDAAFISMYAYGSHADGSRPRLRGR